MHILFLLLTNLTFAANSPIIIGHRGASGYRPEHTLASYELAIQMGADFVEPDLVMTKDHVLVIRHENEISETTDVATKFPDRKTTKTVDGKSITGWFVEDFTLAEIKTLKAKERLAFRDHSFDGKFEVLTFSEMLKFLSEKNKGRKTPIGIYPETKHPTYFRSIGLPLEEAVAQELKIWKLTQKTSPIFLQSFELSSLERLRKLLKVKLIFLVTDAKSFPFDETLKKEPKNYGDLLSEGNLKILAKTIDGVGPAKTWIIPEVDGKLGAPTGFISLMHKYKLKVHPYTFRSDKQFLAAEYNGEAEKEYLYFFELGVDGLFSDFADQAIKAREKFLGKK